MWPFIMKRRESVKRSTFKEELKEEECKEEINAVDERTFKLQVSHGSCTGVFWRGDPLTGARPTGPVSDWPRNGALLKGQIHEIKGQQWLHVSTMRQARSSSAFKTVGKNRWIPFDGGPFNGGKFLHQCTFS
mmetsp:Transcript_13605/g.18145  ORF Transcript_13605/g.18145 Transcript_13605/m.18145 type:complete len:132 (+) Transcript_13605:102-497(+)